MYLISYFSESFPIFRRRPPSWVRNHPPPFINHIKSKRIMISALYFPSIPEVIHYNILQGFEGRLSCLYLMKVLLTSNSSISYGSSETIPRIHDHGDVEKLFQHSVRILLQKLSSKRNHRSSNLLEEC